MLKRIMQGFRCFPICLFVMTALAGFGQQYAPNNPTPPSPNATAIQKYGNTDVGLYTGATNITIPLFTVADKEIALPVSLTYSGSGGIKVEEIASWVGIGWTLNAGGAVSRTILNRADDDHTKNFGYTKRTSLPTAVPANAAEFEDFADGDKDGEPDIFFFNAGGMSGKFIIKHGGDIFQIPNSENKIIAYSGSAPSYFPYTGLSRITAFRIIDVHGVNYWFESVEESNTRPISGTWTDNGFYTSSWYLTKVTNANETATITLNYTPYTYFQYPETVHRAQNLSGGFNTTYSRTEIHGQRLSSISFPQGSIQFVATTERCDLANDNYLEKIQLKDNANNLIKEFAFNYSYFDTNGTELLGTPCDNSVHVPGHSSSSDGDYRLRLRLDELQEFGDNGTTFLPPYEFTYNSSHYLPSRYSKARDHWGFYNGATSNTSLEPEYTVKYRSFGGDPSIATFGSANRNANQTYMKAGLLTKVKYPTGGTSVYTYEAHEVENDDVNFYDEISTTNNNVSVASENTWSSNFTLSNNVNMDVTLSVSSSWTPSSQCRLDLQIKDVSTGLLVKDFTYTTAVPDITLPTGTYQFKFDLQGDPNFCLVDPGFIVVNFNWQTINYSQNLSIGGVRIQNIQNYTDNETTLASERTYEYLDGGTTSGTLLNVPEYGYTQVGNIYGTIAPFGWIRSYHSNIPLATTKGSHVGYSHVTEYLGTKTSNQGKVEYTFTSPTDYPDVTRGYTQSEGDDLLTFDGNTFMTYVFPRTYSQDWRRGMLLKKQSYRKDVSGYTLVREEINDYEFLSPTDLTITNLSPPSIISDPGDYVVGVISSIPYGGAPIYFKYYKIWSGRSNLTSSKIREFDQAGTLMMETQTDYFYENTDHRQLTRTVTTDSEGNQRVTRLRYPHDYGTPATDVTELIDANRIATVLEYRTDVGGVPVSGGGSEYTYNATHANINYTGSFELEAAATSVAPTNLSGRDFTDYTLSQSYTYDSQGRITTMSARDGTVTSFIWDVNNQPIVVGVNISHSNLLTAHTASLGGNYETDLRNHSLSEDALITTYTYELLKGVKKVTDPNGEVTTYHYDPLGRLEKTTDDDGNSVQAYDYNYGN